MGTHPRAVPSGHLTWQLLWPHAGLSRKGAGLPLPAAPGWLLPSGPGAPAHSQKGHSTSDLGQGNTVGRSCPLLASKGMAPQPVGLWGKLPEPSSSVPSLTDFPALPPETHGLRKQLFFLRAPTSRLGTGYLSPLRQCPCLSSLLQDPVQVSPPDCPGPGILILLHFSSSAPWSELSPVTCSLCPSWCHLQLDQRVVPLEPARAPGPVHGRRLISAGWRR